MPTKACDSVAKLLLQCGFAPSGLAKVERTDGALADLVLRWREANPERRPPLEGDLAQSGWFRVLDAGAAHPPETPLLAGEAPPSPVDTPSARTRKERSDKGRPRAPKPVREPACPEARDAEPVGNSASTAGAAHDGGLEPSDSTPTGQATSTPSRQGSAVEAPAGPPGPASPTPTEIATPRAEGSAGEPPEGRGGRMPPPGAGAIGEPLDGRGVRSTAPEASAGRSPAVSTLPHLPSSCEGAATVELCATRAAPSHPSRRDPIAVLARPTGDPEEPLPALTPAALESARGDARVALALDAVERLPLWGDDAEVEAAQAAAIARFSHEFTVTDDNAEWAVSRVAESEGYLEDLALAYDAVKAQWEGRLRAARRRLDIRRAVFEGGLREYAAGKLRLPSVEAIAALDEKQRRRLTRSVIVGCRRLAFRDFPETLTVEDGQALMDRIAIEDPLGAEGRIRLVPEVSDLAREKARSLAKLRETGALDRGFAVRPAERRFYVQSPGPRSVPATKEEGYDE